MDNEQNNRIISRLKFKQIAPGLYESVYAYRSKNGASYEVFIDKTKLAYKIRNVESGRIWVNRERWTNYKVLLRNLRWHLEELGVNFEKTE